MEALQRLVFDNLFLLFAIAIAWNAVAFGFMRWRRKQRGLILPRTTDADVVFAELFASGSSHKSWMTRLGGASNCLTVIVTNSQLAITTFFPFTAFARTYDLEHLVSISDITGVSTRGKVTEVEFKKSDGTRRKVSLRLRDTPGFFGALEKQTNSAQGGGGQSATRPKSK